MTPAYHLLVVVDVEVVAAEALQVEEVLGKRDGVVDSQVVSDDIHEVLNNRLEVVVCRDTNGKGKEVSNNGPNDSWHLGQRRPESLGAQSDGVHVWQVVANGRESEQHAQEFSKPVERVLNENGVHQPANRVLAVIVGVGLVGLDTGDGSSTQNHGENQRKTQTAEHRKEDFVWVGVWLHVDGVVGGVGGPSGSETENGASERENIAGKSFARAPRGESSVVVGNARDEDVVDGQSGDDGDESDHVRDPGPLLVSVDDVVAEEADENGEDDNDQTPGPRWQSVVVDDVEQLGRGHDVHGTPANTGNDVDEGEDPHRNISNKVSRKHHLSETKLGSVDGEEGHGNATQQIEENNGQNRGTKVKAKNTVGQAANVEGGNHHVGREPHGRAGPKRALGFLLHGNHLDTSCFTMEHAHDVGVEARESGLLHLGGLLDERLVAQRLVDLLLRVWGHFVLIGEADNVRLYRKFFTLNDMRPTNNAGCGPNKQKAIRTAFI
ncbi:hypothetical protein KL944_002726 [Ogataea haglerorum]|nr:hypothetical protein KL944_002726 [Ogataea haglerorum]